MPGAAGRVVDRRIIMTGFPSIEYIAWARRRARPVPHDLSASGLDPPQPDLLGADRGSLPLGSTLGHPLDSLMEALETRLGLPRARVLPVLGTTMALYLACGTLLREGDRVVVEEPAYEPLWRVPAAFGARVERLPRDPAAAYRLDLEHLERLLRRPAALVLLSNLHNPSGVLVRPETLRALDRIAREREVWVLMDEVYLEFLDDERSAPAATLGERFLSAGSLTKAYGLGGIRFGWLAGPEPLVRKAASGLDYLAMQIPTPTLVLAERALGARSRLRARCAERIEGNLRRLSRWVSGREDVEWTPPEGGVCAFVRLPGWGDTTGLCEALERDQGTRIVPGRFFGQPDGFRIGFGGEPSALEQGLRRIGAALDLGPGKEG
jgi:aspartate/methionine/tyrosine aminotransferase